jgi:preprotein translocase subunit Sss1
MKIILHPVLLEHLHHNAILIAYTVFSAIYFDRKYHKVLKRDRVEYETEIVAVTYGTALVGVVGVAAQLCNIHIVLQVLCILFFSCINLSLHFGTMKK